MTTIVRPLTYLVNNILLCSTGHSSPQVVTDIKGIVSRYKC